MCLRPGLNVGLAIQSLNHATSDIPTPIHMITRVSASHSHPACGSTAQYVYMLPRETKDAKASPMRQ